MRLIMGELSLTIALAVFSSTLHSLVFTGKRIRMNRGFGDVLFFRTDKDIWATNAAAGRKRQPLDRVSLLNPEEVNMAQHRDTSRKKSSGRKYGAAAGKTVASAMRRKKKGTLKSGRGGKGGTVKSRKQAIAIGLSEARKKGAKVPRKTA